MFLLVFPCFFRWRKQLKGAFNLIKLANNNNEYNINNIILLFIFRL